MKITSSAVNLKSLFATYMLDLDFLKLRKKKEIVYFKDGTCRVYYNITSLGLDFATDLSNIVQYVSVSDE